MADSVAALVEAAAGASTPAEYHRIAREAADLPPDGRLVPLRLSILASASLEFLKPFLLVQGLRRGFQVECYVGGFGQFETELMQDDAPLYAFQPDVLVLSLHPEEIAPEVRDRFLADDGERYRTVAREITERVVSCASRFREATQRPVVVANHAVTDPGPLGPFEGARVEGYWRTVAALNQEMAQALGSEPGVTVWDYAGLIRQMGAGASDPRLWALGRIPFRGGFRVTFATPQQRRRTIRRGCAGSGARRQ